MNPDAALTVSISNRREDIEKAIHESLARIPLGDFRDKEIAIKPNDTTATPRDKTACTQADTLRATICSVKTLHPKSIIVIGGAGKMETAKVFKVLGYPEVIESEGVEWFDHNKDPFIPVDLTFGP
jgi:uncharacterized protein (DUF362 family)